MRHLTTRWLNRGRDKVPTPITQHRVAQVRTLGRMRRSGAIVGMLAVVTMADADTVKGELSFNSEGVGKVLECKSGRIFALGTMATNPYLRLVQRYWRASFHGKTPVLIEVGGVVTGASTPGTALTLESPNVVVLYGGRCSEGAA